VGDENRPVTRYEFRLWREPWEERVRALERWRDGHEEESDDDGDPTEVRERRAWSWPEIVVAGITAAGVVAAAAVSAFGR
jgi:hypothetical protein